MTARSFLYGGDSGGGDGGGGGCLLLANKRVHSSSLNPADPLFVPRSSSFQGSRSMLSFEDRGGQFWQNEDDEYDEYLHQPEKKRRLTGDQVQLLEKRFESDTKLEPERKIKIAKELGLQPRQVAIWFQNRRARWKNKQLEKDYDDLQQSYNELKANYDNLLKEKEKLKSEVDELSDKMMLQKKGTSDSSSTKALSQAQSCQHVLKDDISKNTNTDYGQIVHLTDKLGNEVYNSLVEGVDSSYVFEQEQSEGSLDEENNLSKMLLPCVDGYTSPKIDTDPSSVNSYYLGLPGDDQAFGFWSY